MLMEMQVLPEPQVLRGSQVLPETNWIDGVPVDLLHNGMIIIISVRFGVGAQVPPVEFHAGFVLSTVGIDLDPQNRY